MTAFLLDEMFPPVAARLLRDSYGHDAVHVAEIGLQATDDALVARAARKDGRALVTENVADFASENVADFASERDLLLVFVLKRSLPAGGGQDAALAELLDRWASENPRPYLGAHWPNLGRR